MTGSLVNGIAGKSMWAFELHFLGGAGRARTYDDRIMSPGL